MYYVLGCCVNSLVHIVAVSFEIIKQKSEDCSHTYMNIEQITYLQLKKIITYTMEYFTIVEPLKIHFLSALLNK